MGHCNVNYTDLISFIIPFLYLLTKKTKETLESVMCDIIKINLKRRIVTRSGKGNQPLNIKTAVERPILNLGLPNLYVELLFYFTSRCIPPS